MLAVRMSLKHYRIHVVSVNKMMQLNQIVYVDM